jgi:hypothetical protein
MAHPWSPFAAPLPAPHYDIRRLLPTTDGKSGFESYAAAERERHHRIASLRKLRSREARETADRLEACAPGFRCLSPSCPVCAGRTRIWFYSEIARVLGVRSSTGTTNLELITLVHEDWILPTGRIADLNPMLLTDRVRHQLFRAGAGGAIVIGAVHGEFDQQRRYWQLHLHLAAKGLTTETIASMRLRHYRRSEHIYRPMVVQPLNDPERQISYLYKSYWPMRVRYLTTAGEEESEFRRIEEPQHSAYLVALNQFTLLDFVFLLGARRYGHALRANP